MTAALRTHSFKGLASGPRLIVLGAVHGNETCGTHAIARVLAELDSGATPIVRGCVTFVPVANPLAYQRGERAGERNLNRDLRPRTTPQDFEDRIANQLCPLLAEHEVLLDLHSFHTDGEPFAMLGPTDNTGTLEPFARAAEEEALARRLGPRRVVEGWLPSYAAGVRQRAASGHADHRYGVGTTEYMRSVGGYAITLECGQHTQAQAPEVAYRAIRNTLAHLALIDAPAPPARTDVDLLCLTQVTDLHHERDQLARAWASFDPLRAGELIGTRADGTRVCAPADGSIVFPNPRAQPGAEWFYFAVKSSRVLRG